MIDSILKSLLIHAKEELSSSFTWIGVRNRCLGELYHPEMTLQDVMTITTSAWLRAREESRFKMSRDDKQAIIELLMHPLKQELRNIMLNGGRVDGDITITLEELYNRIIDKMMHDLRMTTISWCRFELFPPTPKDLDPNMSVSKRILAIMRAYGKKSMWTNKYKTCRTVKCYNDGISPTDLMVSEIKRVVPEVTEVKYHYGSIIVRFPL
jgi:hypothetical protein